MTEQLMPQAQDWERFWNSESTVKSIRVSWSKKRIIDVLQQYVAVGQGALDAGCGSGFFSAYFCRCQMKTTALDYSDQALVLAQKATTGQARTVKANLLENKLTDLFSDTFNLVFTDGLFEHFSSAEQDRIMQNLSAVLADNGVLVRFVPNRWSSWELIRPLYMPGIKEVPFQMKDLLELNVRNGLRVIESGGINVVPFRYSPDRLLGRGFGMLLYTVAQKR